MKRLLIGSAVTLLVAGVSSTLALNTPQTGTADTSPIVQQVNHNTDQLANHEARITNTENNVKDLQGKTSTPPSAANTPVPVVATPAPTQPVTGPTVVTVVGSGVVLGGTYDGYCRLTYSDGSTGYTKATLTTTTEGNSTSTADNCRDFVGQAK